MNNQIKLDTVMEIAKNVRISISLEQWPCAVAIMTICSTYILVEILNMTRDKGQIKR